MIPPDQWWSIIHHYSHSIYPAQVALYLLSITAMSIFILGKSLNTQRLVKGFFVLAFGWIGGVFFLVLGGELPAHNAQAFLFLSLSGLFAWDLLTGTTQLALPSLVWQRIAILGGLALVLVGYPLIGLSLGRPTSGWIIPGAFPCPTSALALVCLSSASLPSRRRWLYFAMMGLLLLWAVPFPILIQIPQFGVYEDGIMLAVGLTSLLVWTFRLASMKKSSARKTNCQTSQSASSRATRTPPL